MTRDEFLDLVNKRLAAHYEHQNGKTYPPAPRCEICDSTLVSADVFCRDCYKIIYSLSRERALEKRNAYFATHGIDLKEAEK